jgi:hypothetical protein
MPQADHLSIVFGCEKADVASIKVLTCTLINILLPGRRWQLMGSCLLVESVADLLAPLALQLDAL